MIYAGIDVNIISHARAFRAGPEAMGLWCWSMCYAQVHETDGRVHRSASLAAWGGRRNIMLAKKLEDAGLWVARDDGDWDIWNYGKKNQSAEDIQRKKDAARARKERWKERNGTQPERVPPRSGNAPEHPSLSQSQTPPAPAPSECERAPAPDWVAGMVDSVSATTGETFDRGMVWTKYQATRERDGRSVSAADFRAFLASWASRQKSERVSRPAARGAEATKQPYDPNAPWLKLPEVG